MTEALPLTGKLDSGWLRLPGTEQFRRRLQAMREQAEKRLMSACHKTLDPEVREAYSQMRQIEVLIAGVSTPKTESEDDE